MGVVAGEAPRRFTERWAAVTWWIGGIVALWSAGAVCAVVDCIRRGTAADTRQIVAVFGSVVALIWMIGVVGIASKRRWLEVSERGLRDQRLLFPARTVPWSAIRGVRLTHGTDACPERFRIETDLGAIRLKARLSGWPVLLGEVLARTPETADRLPTHLSRRIRAGHGTSLLTVEVARAQGETLRYSYWRLYVQQLVPAIPPALIAPVVALAMPDGWIMAAGLACVLALLMAALYADYRLFRSRAGLTLHREALGLTDGRGRQFTIPWGSVTGYVSRDERGGGWLLVCTPDRTHALRREFTGIERAEAALQHAMGEVDRVLAARKEASR